MKSKTLFIKPIAISIMALGIGYSGISLAADPMHPSPLVVTGEATYTLHLSSANNFPNMPTNVTVELQSASPFMLTPSNWQHITQHQPSGIILGKNIQLSPEVTPFIAQYHGPVTATPDTLEDTIRLLAASSPNLRVGLADQPDIAQKQTDALIGGMATATPIGLAHRTVTFQGSPQALLGVSTQVVNNGIAFYEANYNFRNNPTGEFDIAAFARNTAASAKQVGYNLPLPLTPQMAATWSAAISQISGRLPDDLAFLGAGSPSAASIGKAYIVAKPTGTLTGPAPFFTALDVGNSNNLYAKADFNILGVNANEANFIHNWSSQGKINSATLVFSSPTEAKTALQAADAAGGPYAYDTNTMKLVIASSANNMPDDVLNKMKFMRANAVPAPSDKPLAQSVETSRVIMANTGAYTNQEIGGLSIKPNRFMMKEDDGVFLFAQQHQDLGTNRLPIENNNNSLNP